jgi:signal transduction histidine kinase
MDVNPAAQFFLGITPAAIGQPVDEALAAWPDLMARYQGMPGAQTEIMLGNPESPRWLDTRISFLYDRRRQLTGRLIVLRDVTERKQAEREIAQMAKFPSENPNPTLRVARDGMVLYANKASSSLLDVWQCQVGESVPGDWRVVVLDALTSNLSREVEIEVAGRILSLTFAPVTEAGYANVYGLDITERKRADKALRQYASDLEARNKELDAFAHTVAHDLKNPLTSMIGYSDLLMDQHALLSPDMMREFFEAISVSGSKMVHIIDALLLLATVRRMEHVKTGPLDMVAIVAEARARLASMVAENKAEVVMPGQWPAALGYGPWVEEVWVNYISNAVKYGGDLEQGIPSRVELGAEMNGDSHVRFWVRDNGLGLVPEQQQQLFTQFTRLHEISAEGYGLGLSIVQRIVERLGGEVGVESQVGQGSTFYFTLPAAESE